MTENGFVQILLYLLILIILIKPLGGYMASVFEGQAFGLSKILGPIERFFYRVCGINANYEMTWRGYLVAVLLFNLFGFVLVYAVQRLQAYLPFNPEHMIAISPALAFNTAVSFMTNTNWQSYAGDVSMSYFTQMLAFTSQNFVSAATGMAIMVALVRGFVRKETKTIGNFWTDLTRGTLYILLPLSIVFSIVLLSQGCIQNLKASQTVSLIQPYTQTIANKNTQITQQLISQGPVASQEAIKQLGSNGGGFFGANSAHPYENPTPLSNFLEMLALLLLPASLCYTYGKMVKDPRQGISLVIAMFLIFIPLVFATVIIEQHGNPAFSQMGVNSAPIHNYYPGGNMEGKETRFGIVNSSIWATATTAASNGSVNSALDSFMPLSNIVPLFLMQMGEVVFGGVGSGLYSMVVMVIVTVFIAGLMVGRTPEYLGKKIEPFEMKMASIALLVMPCMVLLGTAISVLLPSGTAIIANPGAHGFSEILYAYTSMVNNNGSGFVSGASTDINLYNYLGGIGMLAGRFAPIVAILAIAGSLAQKKQVPANSGTLPTHTTFFILFLVLVVIIVGALAFLPALALGPIAEHLTAIAPLS